MLSVILKTNLLTFTHARRLFNNSAGKGNGNVWAKGDKN